MGDYPDDFNPRAELKKKSEKYADYIYYGVPLGNLKDFDEPPDNALAQMTSKFMGVPIFEMWAEGKMQQYYIAQWAMQTDRPHLQAVVKFVLRISHLADIEGAATSAIFEALRKDLTAAKMAADDVTTAVDSARSELKKLHSATRRTPYDNGAFTVSIAPLLAAVPEAAVTTDEFVSDKKWGASLCRTMFLVSQPKSQENFEKAVKPLLIGVGGYGLVTLAFENKWGAAYALKRQSITMIMEKKHEERALLELKIASTIFSPFILDCPYAYIDGKDLVLALRMLPGGDLGHCAPPSAMLCAAAASPHAHAGVRKPLAVVGVRGGGVRGEGRR